MKRSRNLLPKRIEKLPKLPAGWMRSTLSARVLLRSVIPRELHTANWIGKWISLQLHANAQISLRIFLLFERPFLYKSRKTKSKTKLIMRLSQAI